MAERQRAQTPSDRGRVVCMNATGFSYLIQTSTRSRRLTVRVDTNGQVVVTAPPGFPQYRIAEFVESARTWIENQLRAQESRPVLLSAQQVMYFGKTYAVRVSRRFDGTVHVADDMVIVSPLKRDSVARATQELLASWLKARATEYITKRVHELSSQMALPFRGLAFKQQKTRWGSCSSQKNLNFNWKLIHAPKDVIDYVIIHELSHTKHMNHGQKFWDLVATKDPDHTLHRRWLSRFGSTED